MSLCVQTTVMLYTNNIVL